MTSAQNSHSPIPEWTFGDRAKKCLRHAGMSTTDMAAYLGITRETAGRYMSDKQPMPLQTRRLWAMRTGVPLHWLETGHAPESGACALCAIRDLNPEPAGSFSAQVIDLFTGAGVSA